MAESKETSLNRDEEERMLQNPAKEQIVPNTAYQFTPIVEKKKTFLDTLLDLFGSSSSKNEGKASVAKKKKITLLGELSSWIRTKPKKKNKPKMRKYFLICL